MGEDHTQPPIEISIRWLVGYPSGNRVVNGSYSTGRPCSLREPHHERARRHVRVVRNACSQLRNHQRGCHDGAYRADLRKARLSRWVDKPVYPAIPCRHLWLSRIRNHLQARR